MNLKRLPLKGIHNFRDLGGYPAGKGKATKWKILFRADGLFDIEKEDIDFVMDYSKIAMVIDLRGKKELIERPNSFANIEGVKFLNVPLIAEERDRKAISEDWQTLSGGYYGIAEYSKSEIKSIFDAIADTLPEPVLYHCTAGKDRTGIISCLLLGIAGVESFDIVSDYEVSGTYISKDYCKVTDPGEVLNMDFAVSPNETMRNFIKYLDERYGGVRGFLNSCGIEEQKINLIKSNFLVDINDN